MPITSKRLWRALKRAGGVPEKGGGGGHRVIVYKGLRAQVPFHGSPSDLCDGLVKKILADLGLTRRDVDL